MRCVGTIATVISFAFLFAAPVSAQTYSKTLTYTRFFGTPNVKQVTLTYDAAARTTSLTTPTAITHTPGADGLLFSPDGDIIIGGQGDALYKIAYPTPAFTSANVGGTFAYHVMLDPSGSKVWSSGNYGYLAETPLYPFANGTFRPLNGDDQLVTHVIFTPHGAFYTASLPTGNGHFGRIDMNTFTTTRLFTDVRWSHGAALDCYTGDIMVFANDRIAQFDPVSQTVVAELDLAPLGLLINLDQGTADGDGHLYVASNTGYLVFVDLTLSRDVSNPDFVDAPFLDHFLDDIAPECGLGAPPTCPLSQGYWKNHRAAWPVDGLTLGCRNYSKSQLLALMNTATRGDASMILAYQLIAAKLNYANNANNWPLALPLIQEADALLCTYSRSLPLCVRSASQMGVRMTQLAARLEQWNVGQLSPNCNGGRDCDDDRGGKKRGR
ncbi:MAG: hypothetical protein ABL997_04950 [Planctomycetota bacterium]